MDESLQYVETLEYPGRLIIIGKSSDSRADVVMYAITGRSPSSRARKLVRNQQGTAIQVVPTDPDTVKTGQVDLLIYDAALIMDTGIIVGNGKQTGSIGSVYNRQRCPVGILCDGQQSWGYETDPPNHTPRISGCITGKGAALSIIKHAEDGSNIRNYFFIPRIAGKGRLISTYTGVNVNPLPSFSGEPVEVPILGTSAEESVMALYKALCRMPGDSDFRVAAACLYLYGDGKVDTSIINRCDL
jgi:IMP cyclohydrolase